MPLHIIYCFVFICAILVFYNYKKIFEFAILLRYNLVKFLKKGCL